MKYGYIIKLNNLSSFFFIFYIDEEIIKLIDNTKDINNSIEYNIQKDLIEKNITITIIYKPYTSSYILLNNYSVGKLLNIENETNNIYKITKINEDEDILTIENVETKSIETINFNFSGIPKTIKSITKIVKNNQSNQNNQNNQSNQSNQSNQNKENGGEYYYYYSIDQQVSNIIEDLLTLEKENDRNERNKIMKIVKRYIELNKKHYNENNEYIKTKNMFTRKLIEEYNILYTPLSKNLKIKQYTYLIKGEEQSPLDGFYLDTDIIYFFKSFLYEDISDYDLLNQINYNLDKTKYMLNVKKGQDIYLGPGGDLYPLTLQEDTKININGYLSKTKNIIKYEMLNSDASTLLDKSISKYPYVKNLNTYVVEDSPTIKDCDYFPDTPIVYEIKGDYYEFIKKIKPDAFTFIRCFSGNYYSLKDVAKNLALLNIYDLNPKDYKKIIGLLSKHIKQYKIEILKDQTKQIRDKSINKIDPLKLQPITKPYMSEDYYGYSEYINSIHRKLLKFIIIKNNLHNRKENIEIKDEIKENDTPTIDKIYNTKSELLNDKNIIYKDVLNTGDKIKSIYNLQYKSSVENLYELFKKNNYIGSKKDFVSFFKNEFNINDTKYQNIKRNIEVFITENKIYEGDKAYVIEEDAIYIWDNKWVKKNIDINEENANQILKEYYINTELLELKYSDFEYDNLVKEIKYLENKKNKNELKYHNQKWKYSQLTNNIKIVSSPHSELFYEIISQTDLKKKMNDIRIFIDNYTTDGGDTIHWLLCKETGLKLVPYFYKILSDTYIKDPDSYKSKLDEVCASQGKQEGNLFVDKYSGFTISYINFDIEEGFTKEGFKITTREVIKQETKLSIIVSKEDDYIYKNIRTIIDLINIQLDANYIQNMIKHINECIMLKQDPKINKDVFYILSFLSVFFVYIQTYKDIDNLDSFYLNCKPSFNGFPLEKSEDKRGIEYIICIFDNLRKTNNAYPWNIKEVRKMKLEDVKTNMETYILEYVLKIKELEDDLFEKRKTYKKIEKENKNKEQWELFLPRLKPIVLNIEDTISSYKQCFNIQYKINELFIHRKNISTTEKKDYIKYVYLLNNNIELNEELKILIKNIPYKKNIHKLSYLIENTRNDHYKISHSYDNELIYKIIIYLFTKNIKTDYDEYNIDRFYEKNDKDKLIYVKEKITFTDEEQKINIIKLKSEITTMPKIEENKSVLKTFKYLEDYDIIHIEKNNKIKSIFTEKFNDAYKACSSKKSPIRNIFMSEIINIETINKEDADYYADILFNRSKEILTLTNIKKNSNYYNNFKKFRLLPNKLKLSTYHYNEIIENIRDNNIKKEDIQSLDLPDSKMEFFDNLKSIQEFTIQNKIVRLKIAYVVLYDLLIMDDLYVKGDKPILEYLNTKYKNNKILINNYDKISKTKEGEKIIEKKLMTDKLEKMTVEVRRLDTELKQRKLGNWSKGLSDNMYKYSKEGYDKELIYNKELIQALKHNEAINEENEENEQNEQNEENETMEEPEILEDYMDYNDE